MMALKGVTIDEETLPVNPQGNDDDEGHDELEQIAPELFMDQEPGQEVEVVQVGDEHGDGQLKKTDHGRTGPVDLPAVPEVAELVVKE